MLNKKPSVRDRIQKRKDEQKKQNLINFSSFLIDVKHNPMILIGLGGSAVFTTLAGLFIGLAPERVGEAIVLFGGTNDILAIVIGIFFALVFGASFPTIGEWGMYYWHKKASLRDIGNKTQAAIAYGMLFLTLLFTAITAVYATQILASLLSAFTVYATISIDAQKWTITIIPVALIIHASMNIWYDHVSKAAEERREMERELQAVEIEAENRIRAAQVGAREKAATAFAEEYENISNTEAVSAGMNRAKNLWQTDKLALGADREEPDNTFPPK